MTNRQTAPGQREFVPTNRSLITEYIRLHQPVSRASIASTLGLSRAAVSSHIDSLIREGFVYERGLGQSTTQGGRRPIELFFNPKAAYAVGVDIGGTKTLLCISDLGGDIVYKKRFPTTAFSDPELFFRNLIQEIDSGISFCNIPKEALFGIGVAVPGVVHVQSGVVTHIPALGWSNVNVKIILRSLFSGKIYVDNDVNAAALGERWKGVAQGVDNLFMITVGTGVGSAIIAGGQLCRGRDGAAGEIGYFVISDYESDESLANDAFTFGSFERITSGTGIAERAKQVLRTSDRASIIRNLVNGQLSEVTAVHVFNAAKGGDELAWDILELPLKHMAIGIANVVSLLNPEVVIIGGGIAQSGEVYLQSIRNKVEKLTPIPVRIVPATLGNEAGAIGAIAGVLEYGE